MVIFVKTKFGRTFVLSISMGGFFIVLIFAIGFTLGSENPMMNSDGVPNFINGIIAIAGLLSATATGATLLFLFDVRHDWLAPKRYEIILKFNADFKMWKNDSSQLYHRLMALDKAERYDVKSRMEVINSTSNIERTSWEKLNLSYINLDYACDISSLDKAVWLQIETLRKNINNHYITCISYGNGNEDIQSIYTDFGYSGVLKAAEDRFKNILNTLKPQ